MNAPANPLITIITVVKNDEQALLRTIQSVSNLKWPGLEYIVIDGSSTDGTLALIKQHEPCIDHWISEQDDGIYDAMNKGITRSSGDYLLFLNAGDELVADLNVLSPILAKGHTMVYGKANMLNKDGTLSYVKGKPLKNVSKLIRGTPLCHQAIIYKRDSIGFYDTSYRVIADRALTYNLLKRQGLRTTKFVDIPIVNYYEGGFSRQNVAVWQREEIQFMRRNGATLYAFYRQLAFFYKRCRRQVK